MALIDVSERNELPLWPVVVPSMVVGERGKGSWVFVAVGHGQLLDRAKNRRTSPTKGRGNVLTAGSGDRFLRWAMNDAG